MIEEFDLTPSCPHGLVLKVGALTATKHLSEWLALMQAQSEKCLDVKWMDVCLCPSKLYDVFRHILSWWAAVYV